MATNTRFGAAAQALILLASDPSKLHRSEDMAKIMNTNPVVVRRIFLQLQKADLIVSQKGPSGGSRLARSAKKITLRDIYRAVHGDGSPAVPSSPAMPRLQSVLKSAVGKASRAFEDALEETTLSQLAKKAAKKPKR